LLHREALPRVLGPLGRRRAAWLEKNAVAPVAWEESDFYEGARARLIAAEETDTVRTPSLFDRR